MHRFTKHSINHLRSYGPKLLGKIPLRSVIFVMVRSEIPPFLKDNLTLSLALLPVLFNPLILVNLIHELAYTDDKFLSQRLP